MINFSRRQLAKYAVDELLNGRLSVPQIAKHLAAVLAAEKKQKEVDFLLADIDSELEQRGLMAKAKVTSAHQLSGALINELKAEVKKSVGVNEVVMDHVIDEDLIGGFKVETSTRSWDKSLKQSLRDVREAV